MLDRPQIAETAVQPAAIIRLTIPREEIRNVMDPAYGELMAAVTAQGLVPSGPWFTHHLRMDPGIRRGRPDGHAAPAPDVRITASPEGPVDLPRMS
jgi:hypothetical protein